MPDAKDYYSERLSAGRLRRCYEIAAPRIQQYLAAETDHVLSFVRRSHRVVELGCGYGRVLEQLAPAAGFVVGVDTATASLEGAATSFGRSANVRLSAMNAETLGFAGGVFDVVVCIQNGISAFKVEQSRLIEECIRITRPGGIVLLSTYAERFWEERLAWFRMQSGEGLLGEIDEDRTGDGVIVCRDGFRATTMSAPGFEELCARLGVTPLIREVDGSSLFCEIRVTRR